MVCYCLYQANSGRHQLQNCLKLAPIRSIDDDLNELRIKEFIFMIFILIPHVTGGANEGRGIGGRGSSC